MHSAGPQMEKVMVFEHLRFFIMPAICMLMLQIIQ